MVTRGRRPRLFRTRRGTRPQPCMRFTNYSNGNDQVLGISNVKRLGVAPRVGRVGLPNDSPDIAVNVDCGQYYQSLPADQKGFTQSHSWQFTDVIFLQDFTSVLLGVDRGSMLTRIPLGPNRFQLKAA